MSSVRPAPTSPSVDVPPHPSRARHPRRLARAHLGRLHRLPLRAAHLAPLARRLRHHGTPAHDPSRDPRRPASLTAPPPSSRADVPIVHVRADDELRCAHHLPSPRRGHPRLRRAARRRRRDRADTWRADERAGRAARAALRRAQRRRLLHAPARRAPAQGHPREGQRAIRTLSPISCDADAHGRQLTSPSGDGAAAARPRHVTAIGRVPPGRPLPVPDRPPKLAEPTQNQLSTCQIE